MIFDFHTHNTIRPYHSKDKDSKKVPNLDHWNISDELNKSEKIYKAIVKFLSKQLAIDNQAHFKAYAEGDCRVICTALYPIEQGFTIIRNFVAEIAETFKLDEKRFVAAVIGIAETAVDTINKTDFEYFIPLVLETKNLTSGQGLPNKYAPGKSYTVVSNSDQLDIVMADPKRLAVLLTVEGAHSFISKGMVSSDIDLKAESLKENSPIMSALLIQLKANIDAFRSEYPVFVVTFAHHFYNLLCGHSPTLPNLVFNQEGNKYFNLGISQDGLDIIKHLLNRSTRRVLIDTKHMSFRSRIDYHDLVFKIKKEENDRIPIIQTHTAVAARPSMRELAKEKKFEMTPVKWEKENGQHWPKNFRRKFQKTIVTSPLNLFDDEILEIIRSDGLIGIMLDEKRILGKRLPEFTDKMALTHGRDKLIIDPADMNLANYKGVKRKFAQYCYQIKRLEETLTKLDGNKKKRKQEELKEVKRLHREVRTILRATCCAIFMNQILYIARVVNKQEVWIHICIGTDFDGVINSLDAYPDASYLTEFKEDLRKFWNAKINSGKKDFDDFRFGLSVEQILDNIFWENSQRFLKTYFTDKYLIDSTGLA